MKKREYDVLEEANELWLNEEFPALEDIPEHEFSPEFEQKMEKLFRQEKKAAKWSKHLQGLKGAAAAVLVFLGVAVGGISTAQALNFPIIQTIISMVQDFTEYQFSSSTSAPEGDLGAFTLNYLPEGMEEVSRQESPNLYVLEWRGEEGNFLILEQQIVTQDTVSIYGTDEQFSQVTRFMLHGAEAVGREKARNSSIFWTKDNFFYLLSSSLPLEELQKVAEEMSF